MKKSKRLSTEITYNNCQGSEWALRVIITFYSFGFIGCITNTDFFAIDAVVADSSALAPEGTTTVTVTVSLIKTPVETITGTINVELLAEAVLGN